MKSIYQMELEDKFNRKIKYREKKLKNQRMIIGKQQEEIKRLNKILIELERTLLEWHEYWEDDDSYSWQYKNAYDYLQELKGSNSNENL